MDARNPNPVKHKPNIKNNTCIIYVDIWMENHLKFMYIAVTIDKKKRSLIALPLQPKVK